MDTSEKQKLSETIMGCATYFNYEITSDKIKKVVDYWDTTTFSCESICKAYNQFIINNKSNRFPSPFDITQILKPEIKSKDRAIIVSSRIIEAVSKFGYARQGEAFEFIGEYGQEAIRRFGGWDYICNNLGTTLDLTIFNAQLRDLLEAEINLEEVSKTAIGPYKKDIQNLISGLCENNKLPK